jgi:itaconate CoA-transferase
MYVLNGVLMALFDRSRTGKGMAFEVSLFDSISEWMSYPAYYTQGAGKRPRRTGAKHATIAPYGPFRVGDGATIFLGVQNEREWESLCLAVLGDPELAADPRFRGNAHRLEHRAELEARIEARFASLTGEEAIARLDAAGIANAHMNDVEAFLAHPQLRARGRVTQVDTPVGPLMSFLPAVTIPGMTPVMGPVPAVGEHTKALLAEIGLGSA